MKLIDVDALDDAFTALRWRGDELLHWGDRPNWCLIGEEVEKLIADAPIIDAIPVEWLEKRRENLILAAMVHSTVYGDNSIELCHAVNVVLDMWQKEQEAR